MIAETRIHPFMTAHCATICAHQRGLLLACYHGQECTNRQRVVIAYLEDGQSVATIELPYKTGNCVLVPTSKTKATLIFSYFTDTDGSNEPISPVQRWMYCTNWKVTIQLIDGELVLGPQCALGLLPHVGLLTRCAPIKIDEQWILPLYREHDCYGIAAVSRDGWNWRELGKIGAAGNQRNGRFGSGYLIQPTIWHDGAFYHSLSRDVSSSRKAWYSSSVDGKKWSKPVSSELDNSNNSILAIHDFTQSPLIVWNHGAGRGKLVLGRWNQSSKSAVPLVQLNTGFSASYPNYCFDANGRLHIVHTDDRRIIHHILDSEAIEKLELIPSTYPSRTISETVRWWTVEWWKAAE